MQPGTQPDVRRCELQITKQRNSHDQGESHLVVAPDEAALRAPDVENTAVDDREYASLDAIESDRQRNDPHQLIDPLLALHEDHGDVHHEKNLPELVQVRPCQLRVYGIHRSKQNPNQENQQKYRLPSPRDLLRLAGD